MTMEIYVEPNPFINRVEIIIQHERKEAKNCIIQLLDENSRIVRMMGRSLDEGMNTITLDRLDCLPTGNYCLDIRNTAGKEIYHTTLVRE